MGEPTRTQQAAELAGLTSINQLMRQAGIGYHQAATAWEEGRFTRPDTAARIADACGVSLAWLQGGTTEAPPAARKVIEASSLPADAQAKLLDMFSKLDGAKVVRCDEKDAIPEFGAVAPWSQTDG